MHALDYPASRRWPHWTRGAVAFLLAASALCAQTGTPRFTGDPTVHDPSVVRVGDRYYVFGSHLQAAWTDDLMNWQQLSEGYGQNNTLIPNYTAELAPAFQWSGKTSLWAPDVIQLGDGRFYMYYCASEEVSSRASLGIAVADAIDGPYHDAGIILQSGMWGQISPDGTVYDNTRHPHAIDPHVFFDAEGLLWMVYGSYSGGIFILQLDPANGRPLAGQGYGTHLWGGNHARIEGPYMLFNPETGYYYLFVSYGGLGANDGYNIRVARSPHPAGPFLDSEGVDMATVKGAPGSLFDDASIAPYGVKLMGNYRFLHQPGEPRSESRGYLSPGHNSAYHDENSGKFYLFFHTRFLGRGEQHEVRVHPIHFNQAGWPVMAPHRYAGETPTLYDPQLLAGAFKVLLHGKDISNTVKQSAIVQFQADGTLTGGHTGSWEMIDARYLRLTLDGVAYDGVVSHQWDDDNRSWTLAFSALSDAGIASWGTQVARSWTSLEAWRYFRFGTTENAGDAADLADPDGDGVPNLVEYALRSDPHMPGNPFRMGLDESRLTVTFDRLMDASLTYRILAAQSPAEASETIWSSRGTENQLGPVTVADPESTAAPRFLRLEVER